MYHKIKNTYRFALLIIALCAIASFSTVAFMVTSKGLYAKLINVSGRQRMLSQRMAFLAGQHLQDPENIEIKNQLLDSKELFRRSHNALVTGNSEMEINPILSNDVRDIYFGSIDLDRKVNQYVDKFNLLIELNDLPDRQAEVLKTIQEMANSKLLFNLDRVVGQLVHESNSSNRFLWRLEFGLLLFLLAGIVCEARFIFEPLAKLVSETLDQLSENRDLMQWAADHDELTGCANRRKLGQDIKSAVEASEKTGERIAVMRLDLDRFKAVNDTFGHDAGDCILCSIVTKLNACTRLDDVVARIGGDEFVVLLRNVSDERGLEKLATRIIAEIEKPIPYQNQMCSVGCSIGIAVSTPGETHSERMLLDSDIALNEAKTSGRGRFEFVTPDLTDKFRGLERLKVQILDGLDNNEFVPFFQPQICGSTGCIAGVETLARWHEGGNQYQTAAKFIGVAEELNLLEKIDRVVIDKGLLAFSRWKQEGLSVPRIGFNLSMAKLTDAGFISWMESRVQTFGLEPREIGLEILESVMVDGNSAQIVSNVSKLQDKGFNIEIDDFGSGHASMNALLQLAVNRIKIDRSLIQNICEDENSRLLLDAVITLADNLKIETLVEGIETADQVALLSQLHTFVYQGYYFAKPMSFDALTQWVKQYDPTSLFQFTSSTIESQPAIHWPAQFALNSPASNESTRI
ncbi:MAG: EAL domain-containing protein [Planctomycetota bacterium]